MGTSSISVRASHGLLVSYIFKSFILLHAKVIIIPVGVFNILMSCKNGDLTLNYLVLVTLYFLGCKNENTSGKHKLEVSCVGKQFTDTRTSRQCKECTGISAINYHHIR